jgi:hypothetical protein
MCRSVPVCPAYWVLHAKPVFKGEPLPELGSVALRHLS